MPFSVSFAEDAVTEPPLIVSEPLSIPVPSVEEAFTEPSSIVSELLLIPVPDVENAFTEPPLIVNESFSIPVPDWEEASTEPPLIGKIQRPVAVLSELADLYRRRYSFICYGHPDHGLRPVQTVYRQRSH